MREAHVSLRLKEEELDLSIFVLGDEEHEAASFMHLMEAKRAPIF